MYLTVIQPSSSLQWNPGLTGLLAARITFRLQILKCRGLLRRACDKRRIVEIVNRQILLAMENLPD